MPNLGIGTGVVRRQRTVTHGFDGEDLRARVPRRPFHRVFNRSGRIDRIADEQDWVFGLRAKRA